MKKKYFERALASVLVAALVISPFQGMPVRAENTYKAPLAKNVVNIQILEDDYTVASSNSFKLVNSKDQVVAQWTMGKENEVVVDADLATNLTGKSDATFSHAINAVAAVDDKELRQFKAAKLSSYDTDGKLIDKKDVSGLMKNGIITTDLNLANSYVLDFEYYHKTKADYTIPANKIYVARTAKAETRSKIYIGKALMGEAGGLEKPLEIDADAVNTQVDAHIESISDSTYGIIDNLCTPSENETTYTKVTMNFAELCPSYVTSDGKIKIANRIKDRYVENTFPIGVSEINTVNGKKFLFEAMLCISSGAFVQYPDIDEKGQVTFYLSNETKKFKYSIGGFAVGTESSYIDGERCVIAEGGEIVYKKSVPVSSGIEIPSKGITLYGLAAGAYSIYHTSVDDNHRGDVSYYVSVKDDGAVQVFKRSMIISQAQNPSPSNPTPSDPVPSNPTPSDPAPSDPTPSDPAPSDPAPSDPAPSNPAPADPAPSNPAPSDPAPSNPTPSDPAAPTQPEPVIVDEPSSTSLEAIEQSIIFADDIDKREAELSPFSALELKATSKVKSGKVTNSLKWKKVSGADGYIIYGAPCGSKLAKLATVDASKTSWSEKKLKKGIYYKYLVVAYKDKELVCTSKTVHTVAGSKKYSNPTKITGVKTSMKLKLGKSQKLKAKVATQKKYKIKKCVAALRYESSDTEVVAVSADGKITAVSKGKATIYVYAQNGLCKKIKITVS